MTFRDDYGYEIYIEARYSKSYSITFEELSTLRGHVLELAARVHEACLVRLRSFCGPEHVGELPDVPRPADLGDLPEAPATDDAPAFQAWREALLARTFERGKDAGLAEALLTILEARGLPVSGEARARIEGCGDPAVLKGWLSRAGAVESVEALFGADAASSGA